LHPAPRADFPVEIPDATANPGIPRLIQPRPRPILISLASLPALFYDAPMKRCIYLFILVISFRQCLDASDTVNQQEAIARLEQAVSKTNIFELPSFAMKADVRLDNHGKKIVGTYQLLWNGPDQWREGISVPGYSEVEIGGKGRIWRQRSSDFIPFPIYNLHQALGFGSNANSPASMSLVQPRLTPKDTIKRITPKKEHGDQLTCFEIEDEQKHSSEICMRDFSGTIARMSPYKDDDLQPVGGKVFPRHLSMRLESKTEAEVNITELSTPAQIPPETFSPPAGVSAQPGCMNPTLGRLVKRQNPHYPPAARQEHRQGTVAFEALIGTDGVPRIQKVIESAGADFEAASLDMLSQWRYDPAMCSGQPVEVETVLQVNYTLSGLVLK
jgi:TonB family protein